MSRQSKWQREDQQRLAERAAEWLDVLEGKKPEDCAEFTEWLTASPRHAEELLFMTALRKELQDTNLRVLPSVQRIMNVREDNIVPLAPAAAAPSVLTARQRSRAWGLVATVALTVAGALWLVVNQTPTYTTSIGEQRTIRLEDGSTVELNTQSRVKVRYSDDIREIRLVLGEALFAVHEDPHRPFRVVTDDVVIQALGTQFNVDRRSDRTTVSVVEGKVSIEPTAVHGSERRELSAGDEAQVTKGKRVIERADKERVAQAVAWRSRQLVFLSDALADIATEFNRYNQIPRLIIEDRKAGAKKYSGVFAARDPSSLVKFLEEDPELVLEINSKDIVIRSR